MSFPLDLAAPASLGLNQQALDGLHALVERHIGEGRYPGAQFAVARQGKLAVCASFGDARVTAPRVPAREDTLWLLYSNTKVVTACAVWILVEQGALRFTDPVAMHLPGFQVNGKGDITVLQLLTHQGGFPNADVTPEAWEDHNLLRHTVCNFLLEWTPGSKVVYHGLSAHWVAAVLIEALAKVDYRDFIRENVIEPLGLGRELFIGLPNNEHGRAADMHEPSQDWAHQSRRDKNNTPAIRRAGVPGGGGYGTARAMVAFYQMLAQRGTLNGVRLLTPQMVEYVTRNHTGDRVDEHMGMPMHRGIGPHSRGTTAAIRGLGSLASPRTFGHGGVGSSYCWADPDSGVSFAYLTNSRVPDPWHSERLDLISNFVHTAIQ